MALVPITKADETYNFYFAPPGADFPASFTLSNPDVPVAPVNVYGQYDYNLGETVIQLYGLFGEVESYTVPILFNLDFLNDDLPCAPGTPGCIEVGTGLSLGAETLGVADNFVGQYAFNTNASGDLISFNTGMFGSSLTITPESEPSTLALLLSGIGLLVLTTKKLLNRKTGRMRLTVAMAMSHQLSCSQNEASGV